MSTTFAPHESSPLARATSPFKDPRTPPPCTPRKAANIWDEYERRALENAKRRDTTLASSPLPAPHSSRFSSGTVLDIIKRCDPQVSPRVPALIPSSSSAAGSPQLDMEFSTVAICKTCKQAITSASGICEKCKKTIVIPPPGEATPPLSPSCRNFGTTDLPKLGKKSASGRSTPTSVSLKRRSKRSSSDNHNNDPPIRLSSLKPPPPIDTSFATSEPARSRKSSLSDPNEPFLRLQIARKPIPVPRAFPSSPTTPPSTSHSRTSRHSTRPSSLANITTPPQCTKYANSSRHVSATPSELSTLYPYRTSSTATPPSVGSASYSLQNTTSAWDDWESDEEEKAGLVGRGSLGGASTRRDSSGKEGSGSDEGKKMKRRGFVRVISCGCSED
ncbi:hypothetical protein BDV96DRAFT_615927 [Lophiotrema nucula]|uniref:Uncharacterized protein n=1 Tax=Lophiotrema nucula TaxID=690887 RepID=A0A6A5YSZ0_9PLEO|nr:hypothetical protein BDV96DRAFT_615927 [Lophiotrema nucula]